MPVKIIDQQVFPPVDHSNVVINRIEAGPSKLVKVSRTNRHKVLLTILEDDENGRSKWRVFEFYPGNKNVTMGVWVRWVSEEVNQWFRRKGEKCEDVNFEFPGCRVFVDHVLPWDFRLSLEYCPDGWDGKTELGIKGSPPTVVVTVDVFTNPRVWDSLPGGKTPRCYLKEIT